MMAKGAVHFVRSAFNYDKAAASAETALRCLDPSRAVQSQKDEADINTIVKRFGVTGKLPQGARVPTYGDFSAIGDYREAHEALARAEESFLSIPSEVRAKFNHDPVAFCEFVSDPNNLEAVREYGLAPKKAPEPSQAA